MEEYRNKALITFSYDDGRKNNYTTALPIHENYDIPASFAIIAGRAIDPQHWTRHMTPIEIVDAHKRGVEITSHGVMHEYKFTDLSIDSLDFELRESKRILDGFVGADQKISTLCLPYSAFNEIVLNEASKHYSLVRGHTQKLNETHGNSAFVASYGLTNITTFAQVRKEIDAAIDERKWLVLMLHGVVEDDIAQGQYDISKNLLEKILEYVNDVGRGSLMPATFRQVSALRQHRFSTKTDTALSMSANNSYTLADAPGYLITYHKNNSESDTVMITFGGLPSKKTATGFGSNFALKQGYDHIFVAQAAGSQYQELSLEDFKQAVQPYLKGKKAVTYGSSLGAYAALYYGGVIDAAIIASAPKNSAHPSMKKKAYSHIDFQHLELKDVPRSKTPPLVLFDPFREEETNFINSWVTPAYSNASLLRAPYAGHTVLNTMQESGVLKEFITSYIEEEKIISFQLRQEDSYIWQAERGRKLLSESRYEEAKEHFETSLKIRQNGDAAAGLIRVLLKKNQIDSAQSVVDEHYELTGGFKGISAGLRNSISKKKAKNNSDQ